MKKGNIVGEPFAKYVNEQIKQRQSFHGSGFGSSRDPKHIQYLNSKLSWVKMASSVFVTDQEAEPEVGKDLIQGRERLKKLGLSPIENFTGQGLARKSVLFNGLSEFNTKKYTEKSQEYDEERGAPFTKEVEKTKEKFSKFLQRSGISTSTEVWNSLSAYGLGGTDFGLQPMPGITGIEISHLNRGSIRKATVTLKAYNTAQFYILETLYLRLGYTMLLEWGNSHYIENNIKRNSEGDIISRPGDVLQLGNTLIEDFWFTDEYAEKSSHRSVLKRIEKYRERYDGNYDGFFGRVSNFNWQFNPDSSYDITIELMSLGDVIESLKVNTLSKPISTNNNEEVDNNENNSTILNYLTDRRKNIKKLKGNKDFFQPKDDRVFFLRWFEGFDEKYNFYIRFGRFLKLLKENVLSELKNENTKFPFIDIDFDTESNVMPIYPNQFSLDSRVCVIRSGYFDPSLKAAPPWFFDLEKFFDFSDNPAHGKIMNIYLNFDLIEKTIKSNTDSEGNLSLFTLLQSICKEVNKALGSINQLEPIVDEDRNTLLIIDQNSLPQKERDKLRKDILKKEDIEEEQESVPFELYGYNTKDSTSNFVKNFSFKTEIGPDLSTIISIGATAQGTVVGEDATAFSNWNSGLRDRFQQEIEEPKELDLLGGNSQKSESTKKDSDSYQSFSTGDKFDALIYAKQQEYQQTQAQYSEFQKYIMRAWGGRIYGSNWANPQYFKADNNFINTGLKLFTHDYFEKTKQRKLPTSSLGFIPVKLSLEIDGISGVKIYQSLKINTKFLPGNYPQVLEFLITKVNHTLRDNQWTTQIETISQPVTEPIKINIEKEPEEGTEISTRIPVNQLQFSNNLIELLKEEERFRRYVYDDKRPGRNGYRDTPLPEGYVPKGTLTIGYGQTRYQPKFEVRDRPVQIGDEITEAASLVWVENKLKKDMRIVKGWLKVPMTQNEFDALLAFTYNVGPARNGKETFVKLLNDQFYVEAGNKLLEFNKSKGQVLEGLNRRRRKELDLWMKNNPGNP